jgi:pimeloyl-ACP methyl ester carboxylesterase
VLFHHKKFIGTVELCAIDIPVAKYFKPGSLWYVNDLNQINNTLDAVSELRLPWLLLHGLKDDIVPPSDSRDMHQQLRRPSELIELPDAEHSFEDHFPEVCQAIQDWLEKYL